MSPQMLTPVHTGSCSWSQVAPSPYPGSTITLCDLRFNPLWPWFSIFPWKSWHRELISRFLSASKTPAYWGQSEPSPTEAPDPGKRKVAEKSTHKPQVAYFTMAAALHLCGALLSHCHAKHEAGIASFEADTINIPILRLPAQGHLIQEVTVIPEPGLLKTLPWALC